MVTSTPATATMSRAMEGDELGETADDRGADVDNPV